MKIRRFLAATLLAVGPACAWAAAQTEVPPLEEDASVESGERRVRSLIVQAPRAAAEATVRAAAPQVRRTVRIAAEAPKRVLFIGQRGESEDEPLEDVLIFHEGVDVTAPTRWIGVATSPLDEVARNVLNLEEGVGVVVIDVVPEGPADRAGLAKYDVILRVEDRPVGEIGALVAVVNEVEEGKPLHLDVLRRGDELHLEVAPEMRPVEAGQAVEEEVRLRAATRLREALRARRQEGREAAGEAAERYRALSELAREAARERVGRARFFWPGLVEGQNETAIELDAEVEVELDRAEAVGGRYRKQVSIDQDGDQVRKEATVELLDLGISCRIQVERSGQDEPRIHVEAKKERGEEEWDLRPDQLNDLPPEIRVHVEELLDRPRRDVWVEAVRPAGNWRELLDRTGQVAGELGREYLDEVPLEPEDFEAAEEMIELRLREVEERVDGILDRAFDGLEARIERAVGALEDRLTELRGEREELELEFDEETDAGDGVDVELDDELEIEVEVEPLPDSRA